MIFGDIETTEKVEYEDLLKNYYEKMEIIEEQDKEIERLQRQKEELQVNGLRQETLFKLEIERLKEINKELGRDYSSANNGYLRLHSIIKEVREYIKEWQRFPHTNGSTHKELKNLIDILDKER